MPLRLNIMAVCPEHPKWDKKPKFTPLSETTSIPPLSYGIPRSPPHPDPPGGGVKASSYENWLHSASQATKTTLSLSLACLVFILWEGGNVRHCCTLWFGSRFLNLFPYSVLSFCILDWLFAPTCFMAKDNRCVELMQICDFITDFLQIKVSYLCLHFLTDGYSKEINLAKSVREICENAKSSKDIN